MTRTEKVIDNTNNYLRLMRFRYTDLEKLSRLQILHDYYETKKEEASIETFNVDIESAEHLAAGTDLVLPVKVKGIFLTEGTPYKKYYSRGELEKAATNPVNLNFPLAVDHRDTEADKIIGMVDKIEYDETIKGLRWWGHINSEVHARNVIDGAIKEVSVTVYSNAFYDSIHGLSGKDLTFKELSLVWKGACKDNKIEVDE